MNYVNKETEENIFNNPKYDKCLGIISNTSLLNESDKSFGQVVLLINLPDKNKYVVGDMVEFSKNKVKWSASTIDSKGRTLRIINTYWVKPYIRNLKIDVPVLVQVSKLENGIRVYDVVNEIQSMTFKQFKIRKMIELVGHIKYKDIAACENLAHRWYISKDYYKSLNETAKNYRIKHDELKKIYGIYGAFKKKIKIEWEKHKMKMLEKKVSLQQIENIYTEYENRAKESKITDIKKYQI